MCMPASASKPSKGCARGLLRNAWGNRNGWGNKLGLSRDRHDVSCRSLQCSLFPVPARALQSLATILEQHIHSVLEPVFCVQHAIRSAHTLWTRGAKAVNIGMGGVTGGGRACS